MEVGADEDSSLGAVSFSGGDTFSADPAPAKTEDAAEIQLLVNGDVDGLSISVPNPPPNQKSPADGSEDAQPVDSRANH